MSDGANYVIGAMVRFVDRECEHDIQVRFGRIRAIFPKSDKSAPTYSIRAVDYETGQFIPHGAYLVPHRDLLESM